MLGLCKPTKSTFEVCRCTKSACWKPFPLHGNAVQCIHVRWGAPTRAFWACRLLCFAVCYVGLHNSMQVVAKEISTLRACFRVTTSKDGIVLISLTTSKNFSALVNTPASGTHLASSAERNTLPKGTHQYIPSLPTGKVASMYSCFKTLKFRCLFPLSSSSLDTLQIACVSTRNPSQPDLLLIFL